MTRTAAGAQTTRSPAQNAGNALDGAPRWYERMEHMEDIGTRLRAEVDTLVAQMDDDPDADYAALMERYNAMTDEERAAAVGPIDLEKYDFGYYNAETGAGNAVIDGEVADRD